MASTTAIADTNGATAQSRISQTQHEDGSRAGRGRGRGGDRAPRQHDRNYEGQRGGEGRGNRRGRGAHRGNHNRGNSSSTMTAADLSTRFSQQAQIGNIAGLAPTIANSNPKAVAEQAIADDDVEAEVCFICASPVVHNSVAPCNHRTCHICALRMRALYKTKDCAHCRTEAPFVVFTDDASKRYQDFTEADLVSTDENIGIKYEKADIVEDTLLLLRYNCPDADCDVACLGWPDLHRHVRNVHHKKMCDLCTRNKKVFTHEHELYTDKELERHMKKGDDNPGAADQSGFKGHPLCGFCGQRFYGDDELYVHCRAKHERCFICDRREGRQPQYYLNYDTLEQHFRKDHFLCGERDCLDKKFIVFPSEMDLKAHQLQEHGNSLSKDVRRDARVVDISGFDYRAPYIQERRGGQSQREGREGRGRGRGRDPNAEPLPSSTAQPMRRDEQAFQRQMAIHSAQSVSNRTFGGQLTAPAPVARAAPGSRESASVTVPHPSNNINASTTTDAVEVGEDVANLTPQEQARRLRHAAVVERATNLLGHDQLKLNQFRHAISSFRSNDISAAGLIDTFFAIFSDTSSTALGSLVREVADLYEDKSKAEAVRTAWNDWRAINEDYPSLPGPSGMSSSSLPHGWAQVTASTPRTTQAAPAKSTSRVLKLKSSTAQSSRSSVSRTGSWGANSASASAAGQAFPNLPGPISTVTSGPRPNTNHNATPWLHSAAAATPHISTTSSTSRPAAAPISRPAARGTGRTNAGPGPDAFPALPAAVKPTSTIFGYGTGMVRRDGRGGSSTPAAFSWGGGAGAGAGARSGAGANTSADLGDGGGDAEGGEGMSGRKKGGKKRQVLVQWG